MDEQQHPLMSAHESFTYTALSHSDETCDTKFAVPSDNNQQPMATRKNSFQVAQQKGLLNTANTDSDTSGDLESDTTSIACLTNDFSNCLARCCLCFRRK